MTGLAGVRVWPRVYNRPFLCKHLKNEMKVKCENKVACAPFAESQNTEAQSSHLLPGTYPLFLFRETS